MRKDFPPDFLWGATLSSYQTEGGNRNTDWSQWEERLCLSACNRASDHYRLYREDFNIAKSLNLNALRISLEWARLYHSPRTLDAKELTHYKTVIEYLCGLKLTPIVTLHHFTNPLWFIQRGGWLSSHNIDHFLRYLQSAVRGLSSHVEYWMILNEPLVYIYNGFVRGVWPPGITSFSDACRALKNMVSAYIAGYQEIHQIYRSIGRPARVSVAQHMRAFVACNHGSRHLNAMSAFLRHKVFNMMLLEYLAKKKTLDYIGLNYYCKEYVRFRGLSGHECILAHRRERANRLHWHVFPQGLYDLLMALKPYRIPVIITENGSAEESDTLYRDYLCSHLLSVHEAITHGVDVKGYLWWSLIDNFEWDKGFGYGFGLAQVDFENFTRSIRPFARIYAKICKENTLDCIDEEKIPNS